MAKLKQLKLYQVRNVAYDIGRKLGYLQVALKLVDQLSEGDIRGAVNTLEKKVSRVYYGRLQAKGRESLINYFFSYKK